MPQKRRVFRSANGFAGGRAQEGREVFLLVCINRSMKRASSAKMKMATPEGRMTTRLRSWLRYKNRCDSEARPRAEPGPEGAPPGSGCPTASKVGISRELDMVLVGPQRGMKIADFRKRRRLGLGQTSWSVCHATGQEAGPTRQQPFSGEGRGEAHARVRRAHA